MKADQRVPTRRSWDDASANTFDPASGLMDDFKGVEQLCGVAVLYKKGAMAQLYVPAGSIGALNGGPGLAAGTDTTAWQHLQYATPGIYELPGENGFLENDARESSVSPRDGATLRNRRTIAPAE